MIRRLDALEMVSRDLITALGEQEAPPETDNEVVEDDFLLADFKTPNTIIPDEADDLFFNLPGSILIDDECFDDLLKDLSLTYDTAAFVHNRGGVLYNRAVMALQGKDYQAASDFAHKAAEVLEHMPTLPADKIAASGRYAAIVALGCVIRGDTAHFDYVAGGAANGLMQVSLDHGLPVGFGVLTTDSMEQALDRAGGKSGNKGADAALAIIEQLNLLQQLEPEL